MAKEKSPSFQFFPNDFISDEHVRVMTMVQRGVYISLLCSCWREDTIPDNASVCAKLCGCSEQEMDSSWEPVRARFFEDPNEAGRLRHGRLDKERTRQAEWREKSVLGGKTRQAMLQAERLSGGSAGSAEPLASRTGSGRAKKEEDRKKKTEEENSKPKEQERTSTTEEVSESFSVVQERWFEKEFWPKYWRKIDKSDALKAFRKHATTEETKNIIVEAVVAHGPTYLNRQPEHRPHAASWLNKKRYSEPPEDLSNPASAPKSKFELMMESI